MKVYTNQKPDENSNYGVGRVILALFKYLPKFGVDFVDNVRNADIITAHITSDNLPHLDCLHSHGLYWTGDRDSGLYSSWHEEANKGILDSARKARVITVPSNWVGECFRRDMRINPITLHHGLDLENWGPGINAGYLLWGKNRIGDVCDPTPAWEMASRGINTISTFFPRNKQLPKNARLVGTVPFSDMKSLVQNADVYLATTKETFGIQTLEALACGIPVLGYAWGGTLDLVRHQKEGYLVKPGDINGLMQGYEWIRAHRNELKDACLARSKKFTWEKAIERYVALYESILNSTESNGVSVIVTSFNYGKYVSENIESLLAQTYVPDEIIVVNDGSTDNTVEVLHQYESNPRIKIIHQENRGVAASRDRGINNAKHPYVICLDADDKLAPTAIALFRNAMIADASLGIVYAGMLVFNDDGGINTPTPPDFSWEKMARVAGDDELPPTCIYSGSMFRRDMWKRCGGYRQVYAPGEDTEFWVRGLSVGFRAKKISNEPVFLYRYHQGSASKTKKYKSISIWHPWMRDKCYPMAAPTMAVQKVRSYSEPIISVIIPVGEGHAGYLISALDSLLGQTLREWEVIVVDDTVDGISDTLLEPYPFIRLYQTKRGQQGAGAARNLGLKYATAPLVCFLDADDYLMPQALYNMTAYFVNNNGRYVYTDWVHLDEKGTVTNHETPEYSREEWFKKGLHAITVLMETEKALEVGGFDENMIGWEDWDFFVKLAVKGYCGVRLAQPLLGYRMYSGARRENSLASSQDLLHYLREKYTKIFNEGDLSMATCCGGKGDSILQAKKYLADAPVARTVSRDESAPEGYTRMEFAGTQIGNVTYYANGRSYVGAKDGIHDFTNALNEDVPVLERTGRWRKVTIQQPRQEQIAKQPAEVISPTSDAISQRVIEERSREDAVKRLMDAKLQALLNETNETVERPKDEPKDLEELVKEDAEYENIQDEDEKPKKRGRGRPRGSRNQRSEEQIIPPTVPVIA